MTDTIHRRLQPRDISRVALAVCGLLMVPLLAMQFTPAIQWATGDFAAAALLLFVSGVAAVLIWRLAGGMRRALGLAAVAIGLVLVWAQLAVGLIG